MLAKIWNHGPYSEEIDLYRGAEGLLESGSELIFAILVEVISELDLVIVVPWQQADLVSGKVGRENESRPVPSLEREGLPCGVAQPRHVRCGRHERILN